MPARRASTCPDLPCVSCAPNSVSAARNSVPAGDVCAAAGKAPLTLAHLRNSHPYDQLAAGFGIGTTAAYRYSTEAVEVLTAPAPPLSQVVRTASSKAFVLLDGILLPIDRIVADRPHYSGKHQRHTMNVQVLADPSGRLLWLSPGYNSSITWACSIKSK